MNSNMSRQFILCAESLAAPLASKVSDVVVKNFNVILKRVLCSPMTIRTFWAVKTNFGEMPKLYMSEERRFRFEFIAAEILERQKDF
jgi:hypothetical protein